MAEVSGGELQTLISTLQNGNTQLGHIYRQIGGLTPALTALTAQLSSLADSSVGSRLSDAMAAAGPLPDEPEGFVTIEIPGVGPRLIPYYSAG